MLVLNSLSGDLLYFLAICEGYITCVLRNRICIWVNWWVWRNMDHYTLESAN